MWLQTFGGLVLRDARFGRPKPLLLLSYLALEGAKDRHHLAELFWPEAADGQASVRVALAQLRRGAPGAIEEDGRRLRAALRSDAAELLAALEARQPRQAVALYCGAFLDGFYLSGLGVEVEEWIYATREWLAAGVRDAYLELAERDAAAGDFRSAASKAERAWSVPGAAGPDPAALERLYGMLVAGDSARTADLRRDAAELGLALREDRAAARTRLARGGSWSAEVPHNLPSPAASFVGRDPELLELARLLADEGTRIVTLTGPGGIGKTRLAIEAARQELDGGQFPDGVLFVPLESIRDRDSVPSVVARAAEIALQGRQDPLDELVAAFRSKRLLLVLDDCEHLHVGGAIVRLVRGAPGLTVLATSRERLGVDGEQRFPVEGFPPPAAGVTLGDAATHEAIRLFCERARRVDIHFVLDDASLPGVLEICRIVEYSPLGIELAAAWVGTLGVDEIAAELRDNLDALASTDGEAPDRHRSLRAAFEGSWRLLSEAEQDVFRRSSVFEGGFTRTAASRVVGASISHLGSLLDKSVLRRLGGGRFDRHPLVFGYAREKLAERPGDAAETQARHAAYFLELALEAEAKHRGGEQAHWLERLDQERANLRAALAWSLSGGDPGTGLQLAAALFHFWYHRSLFDEGSRWLERALEVAARDRNWDTLRSRLLSAAGAIANELGDDDRALALFEERLALARSTGDLTGEAAALNSMGIVAWGRREYERAQALIEASIPLRRELGQPRLLSPALNNLGLVALAQGRHDDARSALQESLAICLELDDTLGIAMAQSNLGAVALEERDAAAAATYLREALPHYRIVGDRDGTAHCLEGFAALAVLQGQADLAARLAGAAERERDAVGAALSEGERAIRDGRLAPARAALGESGFAAAWRAGRDAAVDALVGEVLAAVERSP